MVKFRKIFILILFVLVFLISYEFIKGNIKLKFFSKNLSNNTIYYCDDDSYILNGNACIKNTTLKALLLGDVDSSGSIDLTDANIIKDYVDLKVELTSIQLMSADINRDGIVDMSDVSILQTNLNSSNNDIGKKYICDKDYELKNDLCIKEIAIEAKEINVKKGDINTNNKFDKNDLDILRNYLNQKGYMTNLMTKVADYNNDEKIDKKDLEYLKKKKLKDINIKKKSKIEVETIKKDSDLEIIVSKNSKKKTLDTDSTIKYYFDVKKATNFYYEWVSISDLETYEKSMCNKLNSNMEYSFDIKVKGNKNHYVMNIYEDEKCDKLVKDYKTEEYKMKSS